MLCLNQCPHCRTYCGRAGVQMLNHYYGGNLTQDRISYEFMKYERAAGKVVAAPEGDLGHNVGTLSSSLIAVLAWAVQNAATPVALTGNVYDALAAELEAKRPVIAVISGAGVNSLDHVVVFDGYARPGSIAESVPSRKCVHVRDPWPGSATFEGWMDYGQVPLNTIYKLVPAGATPLAGIMQETSINADADLDGLKDFDETQRFLTLPGDSDTDDDDVPDRMEIRSYTFYTCGNNDPITFADSDNDGRRAERDCDSDNGGQFDGGEDIHGAGVCNALTNPFVATGDAIAVFTDKLIYFIGESVKLAGTTFQADTTYPVGTHILCPIYADSAAIGAPGTVSTNALGQIPFQTVATCSSPYFYHTIVDVIRNGLYQTPTCRDPYTCWGCLAPFFINTMNSLDEQSSLVIVRTPPMSPAWHFAPDGGHQNTGSFAVMDGFAVPPGQPINTGLRTQNCQSPAASSVYLRFWSQFQSPNAQGAVRLSTNNGASWQVVLPVPPTPFQQGYAAVDLTPFLATAAQQIAAERAARGESSTSETSTEFPPFMIEFLMTGPGGACRWIVDDIMMGSLPENQTSTPIDRVAPARLDLVGGQPNPFRGSTTLRFAIPGLGGPVNLEVFDIAGRRVRRLVSMPMPAGWYQATWDGRDDAGQSLSGGMYFCRLSMFGERATRQLILTR